MKNIDNWLKPKSPEAKNYHEKEYHPQRDKVLKEIYSEMLSVLVWGPGEAGRDKYQQDLFNKRIEIVNKLREELGLDAFTAEEESEEMRKEKKDVSFFVPGSGIYASLPSFISFDYRCYNIPWLISRIS
jgi:hypothetical protein